MIETLNQVIQVLSFIFLGIAFLILVGLIQRVYRTIYRHIHSLQGNDSIGVLRLPRDLIFILLFGFLGAMGLFFSSSLRGYSAFTNETKVGTLKYLGYSKTNPGQILIEYQKTDDEGDPIGKPILVESEGDTMLVWYTLVAVNPNYKLMGVKQLYKIDYVGGDYSEPRHAETNFVAIEGGRQERFRKLRNPEDRSFPYTLWVKSVQFQRVEYTVTDLKKNELVVIKLVHNAVHIVPADDDTLDKDKLKDRVRDEGSFELNE